ncbi:hypothetical protein [Hoylesella oralis]|uniref:hypothetical protein n=1 Tax=Hoylesella oralis TaxID=28134 RepID=UPI0028EE6A80|nr:hypothetical protein [Hoylesella oralis]
MTQVQLSFMAICVVCVLLMAAVYYVFYRFLERSQKDEDGQHEKGKERQSKDDIFLK